MMQMWEKYSIVSVLKYKYKMMNLDEITGENQVKHNQK